MNRIMTATVLTLLLLATASAADMERPKTRDTIGHRTISDEAGYRSPREIDHVRRWRSMPPEPVNELQLQAYNLEGRAWHATPVRKTQRAWLGIRTRALESQSAGHFGVKEGVLVSEVLEEGPALQAGIMPGDVIIAANSRAIHDREDLDELVDCCEPGKTMSVVLVRKGEALKKQIRLASAP